MLLSIRARRTPCTPRSRTWPSSGHRLNGCARVCQPTSGMRRPAVRGGPSRTIFHTWWTTRRALGRAVPQHELGPLSHVKNELGRANEIGVDLRRSASGAAVLEEFRQVTAERLVRLGELTEQDLARQTMTPVGAGPVADLLTLRVMDSWSHEQDIRRAVDRPGHCDGPAVAEALAYFIRLLPYVVGKRAAAPNGSTVVFHIGSRDPVAVEVAGGRGRQVADSQDPAVSLANPVATFAALAGGRCD